MINRITNRSLNFIVIILFLFQFISYPNGKPVRSKNGMVVSASELASKVGVEILRKGGNAIDAAVATGFALAVTFPFAGNIGGGGFMVIHLNNGKNTTIDYREKAPLSAFKDMYLDSTGKYIPELSKEGTTSAGVPGSVAGLIYALEKYGTLKLDDVIQPAIDLARNGFKIDDWTAKSFQQYSEDFNKYPSTKKIFTKNGESFQEGDLLKQTDLALTLEKIKEKGNDGFYKGKVAELIVKQIKEMGGYITLEDLEKYKPVERKPVVGTYRGYKIISMPPPSSGGVALIQMLNILEHYNFNIEDWGSSYYYNKLVESMKYAYADRSKYLGDPDFFPVPVDGLISKIYADSIYKKINDFAIPSKEILPGNPAQFYESTETTHYSIYDSFGNAVSVTTTLNAGYGSKIVVEGAGFLLNNEMDDFSAKPNEPNMFGLIGGEANSIQPEKRMLSSMTPTIVLKDEKPFIIIGSPGGSTIITTVLQVILNCIDFKMNIQEAINKPRIHHQWLPDIIFKEKFAITKDVQQNLLKMGYNFDDANSLYFSYIGVAQGIMIDNENKVIFGGTDPRSSGAAIGY